MESAPRDDQALTHEPVNGGAFYGDEKTLDLGPQIP